MDRDRNDVGERDHAFVDLHPGVRRRTPAGIGDAIGRADLFCSSGTGSSGRETLLVQEQVDAEGVQLGQKAVEVL